MEPATKFAEFAEKLRFEDITPNASEIVTKIVLDYFGNSLSGSGDPVVKAVFDVMSSFGGAGQSTVLAHDIMLPSIHAALVNGTMGTASDFEDTHEKANTHLGSACIPAALAAAETAGTVSGKEFITALTAAMEIGARIGMYSGRLKLRHIMGGWDFAALHGSFTAAIASGKILGLDKEGFVNALGLAYHQASGNALSGIEAADTKELGAGFAARNGLTAALMAKRGITGARSIFGTNEYSLLDMYHGGGDPAGMIAELGTKYHVEETGFKPYPCCLLGHRYVDAVFGLIKRTGLTARDMRGITAYVCSQVNVQLCEPRAGKIRPQNRTAAQFSLPWMLACVITRGRLGLSEFSPESLEDTALIDMAGKIDTIVDTGLHDETGTAKVIIRTSSDAFEVLTKAPYGSPDNPMDWASLESKFRDNAKHCRKAINEPVLDRGLSYLRALPELEDVNVITRLFA